MPEATCHRAVCRELLAAHRRRREVDRLCHLRHARAVAYHRRARRAQHRGVVVRGVVDTENADCTAFGYPDTPTLIGGLARGQRALRHRRRLQLHHAQQVLRLRRPEGLDREHEHQRYGARRRIQLRRRGHALARTSSPRSIEASSTRCSRRPFPPAQDRQHARTCIDAGHFTDGTRGEELLLADRSRYAPTPSSRSSNGATPDARYRHVLLHQPADRRRRRCCAALAAWPCAWSSTPEAPPTPTPTSPALRRRHRRSRPRTGAASRTANGRWPTRALAGAAAVVFGSMNWTGAGDTDNDENTLYVKNAGLAAAFPGEFERQWADLASVPACTTVSAEGRRLVRVQPRGQLHVELQPAVRAATASTTTTTARPISPKKRAAAPTASTTTATGTSMATTGTASPSTIPSSARLRSARVSAGPRDFR